MTGHKEAGKVGFTGRGAVTRFIMGGPVGAGLGAAAGAAVWFVGSWWTVCLTEGSLD